MLYTVRQKEVTLSYDFELGKGFLNINWKHNPKKKKKLIIKIKSVCSFKGQCWVKLQTENNFLLHIW